MKTCYLCPNTFIPNSSTQKYCHVCKVKVMRDNKLRSMKPRNRTKGVLQARAKEKIDKAIEKRAEFHIQWIQKYGSYIPNGF